MVLPKRPSQFCNCGKPAKVCQSCHDALQSQYQELLQAKNDVVRETQQLQASLAAERDTVRLMDLACTETEREVDRLNKWIAWLEAQDVPPGLRTLLPQMRIQHRWPRSTDVVESSFPPTDPKSPPDQTPASSATG